MKICEDRAGSRRALAKASGVPQTTIRGYTARSTEPPRDVLVQIAKAAGVSVHWLVTGEGAVEQEAGPASEVKDASNLDEGFAEVAAAVAKKFAVPIEFAYWRLTRSAEMEALEDAMREWCNSRPIPVAGTGNHKIWGVLTQEDLEAAAPGSKLKDIELYRVSTGKLPQPFAKGDWALVDRSKGIANGDYCVLHQSTHTVEIRKLTITPGQIRISGSRDCEVELQGFDFHNEDELRDSFTTIGRLVGAIRFVANEQPRKA
jgi:transcriptional regulator with XRE-family HTH domain